MKKSRSANICSDAPYKGFDLGIGRIKVFYSKNVDLNKMFYLMRLDDKTLSEFVILLRKYPYSMSVSTRFAGSVQR